MKKRILILSALCLAFASMMYAQEVENQPQQVEEEGCSPLGSGGEREGYKAGDCALVYHSAYRIQCL